METNIYQTPAADLSRETQHEQPFYIVSVIKFLTLYLITLGIYGIYWFYRHWQANKSYVNSPVWPVPRAIFSIFFAYSLFAQIDQRARQVDPELRWNYGIYAGIFIVFEIVGNAVEFLSSYGVGELTVMGISLTSLLILAWTLAQVQIKANLACNDARGASNSRFTAANLFWILLGSLFWLATILGLVVTSVLLDLGQV